MTRDDWDGWMKYRRRCLGGGDVCRVINLTNEFRSVVETVMEKGHNGSS